MNFDKLMFHKKLEETAVQNLPGIVMETASLFLSSVSKNDSIQLQYMPEVVHVLTNIALKMSNQQASLQIPLPSMNLFNQVTNT